MVADEKNVFALISAIGALRDRLRHDIDGLRQIHNRRKDGNGSPINLIAQLTALKSSYGSIQDWLDGSGSDLHPQLLTDLDMLTHSSDELSRYVNSLIKTFQQSDLRAADFAAKLKYALASRTMGRLQTVAQRQNDAVNLLLAACHCTAQAQRKILLYKSRQIRQEDVANLKLLSQSSRWSGGCIAGLAQLSSFVQWLKLLFNKKSAQNPLDRNVSPSDANYEHVEAINRSEAIDRALQREATNLRHETKLILVGKINSGKDLLMHQLKMLYAEGHQPANERIKHRCQIIQVVYSLMQSMADLLKDTGVSLPSELNQHFATLLNELEAGNEGITPDAAKAIDRLWSSPQFSKLYDHNFEIDFPQYAPYFAQEVARIADQDYVPTEADIIRLNQSMRGIKELRFNWDELDIHLFNIKEGFPDQFRERWFHQLEGAAALMYTIDVSLYDKPSPTQPNESLLMDEFRSFESWISQPGFSTSSIIIIFNNYTRFTRKMPHSPLEKFFPDYSSSKSEPEVSARQYIMRHLKTVNHRGLFFYSFWVDLDTSDNKQLYSALKTTLAQIQQRRTQEEAQSSTRPTQDSEGHSKTSLSNIVRTYSLKKKEVTEIS
ncbi:hypothetical protein COCSADRAFT_133578 [Bipolaris sorokiniana ND90Pr]|uniref:Guanine nucleotide-binding protein alpha-3 subunit n=1 Tax=Cochliobolus sativus (strain ND90Pr / ATCC 201652) TaxID=665912 RepID=M2TFZ0_COCSN|nr:uncharacterized protein COCSADRAFT_133578 [Bipolaris sorokiniana ND90Pr]EMD68166.1 hypothetical protein COCSADRAFT_133578 [Bipolaris sorokiniana ND90Pr]